MIQLWLVDATSKCIVQELAKGLPNSDQCFSCPLHEPGMFQVYVEGYNEKQELQDWRYSNSFACGSLEFYFFSCRTFSCLVADGERELGDNAIKLMAVLYPSCTTKVVGRFSGGFNSIVAIRGAEKEDLILRTRKDEPLSQVDFDNITMTLTVVSTELQLPFAVPKLLQYDATQENDLGRQYWLQTRVPGVALSEILHTLDAAQRIFLAREMAKCVTAISKKTFRHCGEFVRHPTKGTPVIGCPLFHERVTSDDHNAGYFEYAHFVPEYQQPSNLYGFLKDRFEAIAKSSKEPQFKYFWLVAQQLLKGIEQTILSQSPRAYRPLPTEYSGHCHRSLCARNVYVCACSPCSCTLYRPVSF